MSINTLTANQTFQELLTAFNAVVVKINDIETGADVNPGLVSYMNDGLMGNDDVVKLATITALADKNPLAATITSSGLMAAGDKEKLDNFSTYSVLGENILTSDTPAEVRTLIGALQSTPTVALLASLTDSSGLIYFPSAFSIATTEITSIGMNVLDDGNAAIVRTTLDTQVADDTLTGLSSLPATSLTDLALLAHLDSYAANVIEETGKSVASNHFIVDTEVYKFRNLSHYFANKGTGTTLSTSDHVAFTSHADFDLKDIAFTIEGWFRWRALPEVGTETSLIRRRFGSTTGYCLALEENAGYRLKFEYGSTGSGITNRLQTVWTPTLETWYHIAIVRESASDKVLKLYIDGVLIATTTLNSNFANATTTLQLAGNALSGTFNGWMNDIRVSKKAQYTSGFSVPTAPFDDNNLGFVFDTGSDVFRCRPLLAGDPRVLITNPRGIAGNPTIQRALSANTYSASTTWNRTHGEWVLIACLGAGGGGGGVSTTTNARSGGGGGGAFDCRLFRMRDLPPTLTVTVGAGGPGGSGSGTTGTAGGDSKVAFGSTTYVKAGGGGGGAGSTQNAIRGGGGGGGIAIPVSGTATGASGSGTSGGAGRGSGAGSAGNPGGDSSIGGAGGGGTADNANGGSSGYGGGGGGSSDGGDGGSSIYGGGGGGGGNGGAGGVSIGLHFTDITAPEGGAGNVDTDGGDGGIGCGGGGTKNTGSSGANGGDGGDGRVWIFTW